MTDEDWPPTARAEVHRLIRVCHSYEADAEIILAPALGYPPFEPGSPGYNEKRINYNVGDHVSQTLMMEAAKVIADLKAIHAQEFEMNEDGGETFCAAGCGEWPCATAILLRLDKNP